jgi:soluble lytic murein transglycosylase
LRAAGVTDDSAARVELYAELRSGAARERITATEAAARERLADWEGAAIRYDSLGREAEAWRVRLRAAGPAARAALRAELSSRIRAGAEPGTARALSDVFLQAFPRPTPAEALLLARAAGPIRHPARVAALYPAALAAGLASSADRLAYAGALADLGRHREALVAFERVRGPVAAVAEARYRAARSRLRLGDRSGALAALWQVVERYPAEQEPVANALLLAGDLARDAGDLDEARKAWLELARQHPASGSAGRARFLAALVAYERGQYVLAAREWGTLRHDMAGTETAAAAGFWAGRAWLRMGAEARADSAWRSVAERDTLSYYAVLSARRMNVVGWAPAPAAERFEAEPELHDAMARIALLRRLDMRREIDWERDGLVAAAAGAPERLLAIADAFRGDGQVAVAARMARHALSVGAPADTRTYRLLYPLAHGEEVRRLASEAGIEPGLVAALVRQESAWEPGATSAAGARGLMQVMPATGAQLARRLGIDGWSADRLYEPEFNLRLGVAFLADVLRRYDGDPVRALAAYNAGPSRVTRWTGGSAAVDPDLFVERIPYTETRDYVRLVIRNLSLYRALYDPAA